MTPLSQGCVNETSGFGNSFNAASAIRKEALCDSEPESIGFDDENEATDDDGHVESHREHDMKAKTHDESESLSDIDDLEVQVYLHNEEERNYKKIIWEQLNCEYVKEQAAKKAAGKKGELKASVAKSRKGKKLRTQDAKSSGPAQSAAEATDQMIRKKRLSSKVNFEMVEKLFDEPTAMENSKKARYELCSDDHDNLETELKYKNRGDELGSVEEFEDTDDIDGSYENNLPDENVDEGYNYEEEDYSYE